jgi:hypothetical protein
MGLIGTKIKLESQFSHIRRINKFRSLIKLEIDLINVIKGLIKGTRSLKCQLRMKLKSVKTKNHIVVGTGS